ncbi:hypothetical protein [Paenisporosarcina sp. OV554]|uniref:hypothetical protein n=1 Tax=Paenisporosarcina sp. OV554 TaxID=2135694 RepID=UPI000D3C6837|nr:hypothetical protein [Paenisporosarcina sp. OV554]PUB09529.1 hypothetical protein C8K15_12932 [Paenisporosarcina sp. OV554]
MKGKRFKWLPVILISLLAQFIILQFLLFIEVKLLPTMSFDLLIKINFFIIAIIGGLVAIRYSINSSRHIGGVCGALFIALSELYSMNFTVDFASIFVLLIAYLAGYIGSTLYTNKIVITRIE